jgi:FkbM family methyltransferase
MERRMKKNSIDCVVADAGARYGLHPSWGELRHLATFHLFEIDSKEAKRLKKKYIEDKNITVHHHGLYSETLKMICNIKEHRALTSLYETNNVFLDMNQYRPEQFKPIGKSEVFLKTIDSVFEEKDVHFLKLDVEGAELEVLKGASEKLKKTILGVRSEVCFAPIFRNSPMFGEIHDFLCSHGFELLNMDYSGNGNKAGRYTTGKRYGKLISTDAVWVISNNRLFSEMDKGMAFDIIRFCIFLILNNAEDLAIETLLESKEKGVKLSEFRDDRLYKFLHFKCLLLFKELMSLPMFSKEELLKTYKDIFELDFPDLNRFYETEWFT